MSEMNAMDFVLYAAVGGTLGLLYFFLLHRAVRLHAQQAATLLTIPLHLSRVALAVLAFWSIAQEGSMPLLSALLGFLIARYATQRMVGPV